MIIYPGITLPSNLSMGSDVVAVQPPQLTVNYTVKSLDTTGAFTAFTPVTGTSSLGDVSYSISPDLPSGVFLNSVTGEISGSVASAINVNYTITITDKLSQSVTSMFNFVVTVTPPGQVEFTTPGSTTWTVPAGVTSISIVTVGGGSGGYPASSQGTGGTGATLSYKNNIAVTPGSTLDINVAAGGISGQNGGNSSVSFSGTILCRAMGGRLAANSYRESPTDGGGVGGSGGSGHAGSMYSSPRAGGGGGGAGGYTGSTSVYSVTGGGGGVGYTGGSVNGGAGTGGGGGGGSGGYSDGYAGGGGGGVGLSGAGTSGGAQTSTHTGGKGGSGGGNGSDYGGGGLYGGGGGGGGGSSGSGGTGGGGGIRIIWPGNLRQYPSTRTASE